MYIDVVIDLENCFGAGTMSMVAMSRFQDIRNLHIIQSAGVKDFIRKDNLAEIQKLD